MRILGLDYGDSRIGVALSDEFGWTAAPLEVIDNKRGQRKAHRRITELIAQKDVHTVVVGYPVNMNGTLGPRVQVTDEFCLRLAARNPGIEIVKWDERLTTVAADRTMRELGVKQEVKGYSDMLAAAFILQGYLDSLRSKAEAGNTDAGDTGAGDIEEKSES